MDASRMTLQRARLIIHPPDTGCWNMAVDEALLRSAAMGRAVTLRIYQWDQPTLSLGYFQQHAQRERHPMSRHCPLVRRATGGGAIVHDRELTYSLTGPVPDRWDTRISSWYHTVHQAWVTTLQDQAAPAELCQQLDPEREDAFLCFQRRTVGDLLLQGHKVGGSAQRRHRHAVLQHGSLLLAQSPAAPELPGLTELTTGDWSGTAWRDRWIDALGRALRQDWQPGELTDQEREQAALIEAERFGQENWSLRR